MGSSNSSRDDTAQGFIEEAHGLLSQENYEVYRSLRQALQQLYVVVSIEGEQLEFGWTTTDPSRQVQIELSRRTLLRLIDGELSLPDALESGALSIHGSRTAQDKLLTAMEGAVKLLLTSRSFPALLDRFRESVSKAAGGSGPASVEVAGHEPPQPPRPGHLPPVQEPPPRKILPVPAGDRFFGIRPFLPDARFHGAEFAEFTGRPDLPRVLVFGAGIAGLTAAHELCVRGYPVVVIESAREPGSILPGGIAKTENGFVFRNEARPMLRVLDGEPDLIARDLHYDPAGADPADPLEERSAVAALKAYRYQFAPGPRIVVEVFADTLALANDRADKLIQRIRAQLPDVNFGKTARLNSQARRDVAIFGPRDPAPDLPHPGANPDPAELDARLQSLRDYAARFPGRKPTIRVSAFAPDQDEADARAQQLADAIENALGQQLHAEAFGFVNDPAGQNRSDVAHFDPYVFSFPGEHGFRFFPSFYRNLFDTMKRTPLISGTGRGYKSPDEPGHCVYDNLVPTENLGVALVPPQRTFTIPRRMPSSFKAIRDFIRQLHLYLGFSPRDMVRMERKLLQYATSCSPRRAADYERVSWFDFVGGDAYSPLVRKYLEWSSQALGALLASRSDARTYGNTVVQLLLDQFVIGEHADSTLAGPTSEMWFDHWRTYLEREGVLFRRGRLTGFRAVANGHLPVISDEDPADPPWQTPASNDDYFVLALSVQEMRALVDQWPGAPGALPPDLRAFFDFLPAGWQAELAKAQPGGPLKHLSGVQFFFGEELHFVDGHVLYPDSTWGLTSISQTPHWYRYRGRWDGYRTSLSVDIGDWATADTDTGKAAWNCTADEIARTVWKQISTALADRFKGPRDTQMPPVPDYYHLDREIEFGSRAGGIFPVDDRGPFLVNEVSMFDRRPGVPGSYRLWGGPPNDDRWVLAGNYMRTFTRLTTMEARNESARHAVNAVLRATTRPAPYVGDRCPVFDPEENEPPDLRWLRDLDKYLFDNNAPHWLDIEGAGEVLEQLLPSSNTALQELLGAIT